MEYESRIENTIDVYSRRRPDVCAVEYEVRVYAKYAVDERVAEVIPDKIIANALVGMLREMVNSSRTGAVIETKLACQEV